MNMRTAFEWGLGLSLSFISMTTVGCYIETGDDCDWGDDCIDQPGAPDAPDFERPDPGEDTEEADGEDGASSSGGESSASSGGESGCESGGGESSASGGRELTRNPGRLPGVVRLPERRRVRRRDLQDAVRGLVRVPRGRVVRGWLLRAPAGAGHLLRGELRLPERQRVRRGRLQLSRTGESCEAGR